MQRAHGAGWGAEVTAACRHITPPFCEARRSPVAGLPQANSGLSAQQHQESASKAGDVAPPSLHMTMHTSEGLHVRNRDFMQEHSTQPCVPQHYFSLVKVLGMPVTVLQASRASRQPTPEAAAKTSSQLFPEFLGVSPGAGGVSIEGGGGGRWSPLPRPPSQKGAKLTGPPKSYQD